MGTILPYYSPGLTGGGVSDNFLKDMMAEMQAGKGMPDMGALAGGSGSGNAIEPKKKEKKDKKKGKS